MSSMETVANNNLKTFAAQATPQEREKLQKQIRVLVGQVFFGTMLKQMRSETDASNPLNGGKMGQTFTAQLDQTLISKLAESKNFTIGQKIAEAWTESKHIDVDTVKAKYQTVSQESRTWMQH
jgi:Rod binding domain-containing protein